MCIRDRFLGTVLETVNRALSSHQEELVRAAAGQVKFLLLEMLAFEPMDRPDAHTVEHRIRKIRKALPAPWLREWSDRTVRRVQNASEVPDDMRGDTGKILLERAGAFENESPTGPMAPFSEAGDDSSSIRRRPTPAAQGPGAGAPHAAASGVPRGTVAALMAGSFLLGAIVGVVALILLGG